MPRCAKIVATLGPASLDQTTIRRLIQAGMNVARLNFSHSSYEVHAAAIQIIHQVSGELNTPVAILQDLQGPKIRIGDLPQSKLELVAGDRLILSTRPNQGSTRSVMVDFEALPQAVKPGSSILLADGQMELRVIACRETEVETEVLLGGTLTPHKGVNLPGTSLKLPGFTEKDAQDLDFGLAQGVDAVAISFVRTPQDVQRVRAAIQAGAAGRRDTPIIAKLERLEAIDNLEAIIAAADGVMVARGDLGVEMSPEEVPIAQKQIITAANQQGKIVITATQMLESMIENPRPTRAEASDVANAIFDGTDAVMLSGETAIGSYPVKAVEMMAAIIQEAEEHLSDYGHWKGSPEERAHDDAVYISRAARELAHDRHVSAIAVFTRSGRTAQVMSKTRPGVRILGFTPLERTYRRLSLYWGVRPYLIPMASTMEEMLAQVEQGLIDETPIEPGQQVVLVCGFPVGKMQASNLVLLHTVGHSK